MSKFFRLCSCELTKIMKKKSTKVMLILLILSLFASAGMAVLTKKMYSITDDIYSSMDYNRESIKSEIESLKTEMSEENLDETSKNSIQAQIDALQLAIDNDINVYTTYWKSDLITDDIAKLKTNVYNYKSMGQDDLAIKEQTTIDKLIELLKNDDFNRIY